MKEAGKNILSDSLLKHVMEQTSPLFVKGSTADYIPELAHVLPHLFSLSCVLPDASFFETGDTAYRFTMQSVSKVLVLAFALKSFGEDRIFQYVGTEPSADSFNSLMRLEMASPKPSNPFMNAGAIAMCGLLQNEYGDLAFDKLSAFIQDMTGTYPDYNEKVYESERATADRNRALAYFMKSMGAMPGDVKKSLDLYFKICSINCATKDLASAAAVIACGGVSPLTGKRILNKKSVNVLLGLMSTCGLYDGSGEFAIRVGVPGKSGVGGGILAVVPGKMGVCVFSPALDARGNSVAGMAALEMLSDLLDFRNIEN